MELDVQLQRMESWTEGGRREEGGGKDRLTETGSRNRRRLPLLVPLSCETNRADS